MRIGIDCRVLATGRTTGIEEYLRQLLRHLIPLDRRVSYVLFGAGRNPTLPEEDVFQAENVQLSLYRRSGRALLASMRLRGKPYLDDMVGGVDVFFFPHLLFGATSPRCSRVLTVHDLSFERFPEHLSLARRAWHQFMNPRAQAERADRIIAVSRSTSRDIEALYQVPAEHITVVHSGVPSSFRPMTDVATEAFRQELGLPHRFLLALGTREPRKNLEGLVSAFELLAQQSAYRDVHLYLVGPPGWRERRLRSMALRSPVTSRIHIRDAVDAQHRTSWYACASALVYPSFTEGFGFPPLEAMAVGTPVIASRIASLPEVVGDAGLLVDPYRTESLASAMGAVLSQEALARRCIKKGLDRAATFTWDRAARQTLEVLVSAAV